MERNNRKGKEMRGGGRIPTEKEKVRERKGKEKRGSEQKREER